MILPSHWTIAAPLSWRLLWQPLSRPKHRESLWTCARVARLIWRNDSTAGELDVAIGGLAAPAERFSDRRLFDEGFAALVRRGHPAAAGGALDIEALGAYPHLALSLTREEASFVDVELAKHGLVRRIALRAPLLAATVTLAQSDMVAIIGERSARIRPRGSVGSVAIAICVSAACNGHAVAPQI
jgi:LysR substrate binding domain